MKKYFCGVCACLIVGCGGGSENQSTPGLNQPGPENQSTSGQDRLVDSLGRPLGDLSARIVNGNRAAESALHLVARLEVQEDELLEFYEISPGLVVVSGAGAPAGGVMVDPSEANLKDATQLWSHFSNGAPMPQLLADALSRTPTTVPKASAAVTAVAPVNGSLEPAKATVDVRQLGARPEGTRIDQSIGAVAQAASTDWCDSTWYTARDSRFWNGNAFGYCPSGSRAYDFEVCWDHAGGAGWAWDSNAAALYTNVCPYWGDITFQITTDQSDVTHGSWTVFRNTARWMQEVSSACTGYLGPDCPYVRADILDADGDGYNFRYICDED